MVLYNVFVHEMIFGMYQYEVNPLLLCLVFLKGMRQVEINTDLVRCWREASCSKGGTSYIHIWRGIEKSRYTFMSYQVLGYILLVLIVHGCSVWRRAVRYGATQRRAARCKGSGVSLFTCFRQCFSRNLIEHSVDALSFLGLRS